MGRKIRRLDPDRERTGSGQTAYRPTSYRPDRLRCFIADISKAIGIRIGLVRIGNLQAVIEEIADPVPIKIRNVIGIHAGDVDFASQPVRCRILSAFSEGPRRRLVAEKKITQQENPVCDVVAAIIVVVGRIATKRRTRTVEQVVENSDPIADVAAPVGIKITTTELGGVHTVTENNRDTNHYR